MIRSTIIVWFFVNVRSTVNSWFKELLKSSIAVRVHLNYVNYFLKYIILLKLYATKSWIPRFQTPVFLNKEISQFRFFIFFK